MHRPRNHISAKVIDYNDQGIRFREYLLFRGIPSAMYFQLSRKRQCIASFPANVCNLSLKRLHPLPQAFAIFAANVCGEDTPFVESLPPMFSDEPQI